MALPMLRGKLSECLATEDAREGLTAFLEKTLPHVVRHIGAGALDRRPRPSRKVRNDVERRPPDRAV